MVDTSTDMLEMATRIASHTRGAEGTDKKKLHWSQHLPQGKGGHDLVIAAHSLCELPSQKSRLRYLDTLWKHTNKYLVLVDYGGPYGHELMCEAREYIGKVTKRQSLPKHSNLNGNGESFLEGDAAWAALSEQLRRLEKGNRTIDLSEDDVERLSVSIDRRQDDAIDLAIAQNSVPDRGGKCCKCFHSPPHTLSHTHTLSFKRAIVLL
eukprot:m.210928 g.210928  ORF g.210928 m.210928 type:complete len:208 (-) comp15055_c0_seq3:201-824(-)